MPVSSDGVVTSTVDATTKSVKVAVDFTAAGFGGLPAGTINLIPNPGDEVTTGMFAEASTTVARTTAQAFSGVASSSLTCTSAGTIAANCGVGVAGQDVTPGATYSASAYVRTAVTARVATILIDWYTKAGAYISSAVGTGSNDSTSWTRRTVSGAAPATAAFATVKVTFNSAAVAEVHYVDARQLERAAAATAYAEGGRPGVVWQGAANASPSVRPPYNRVTVYHSGGTAVRGLHYVLAPQGIVGGYDTEIVLGASTEYVATISNGVAVLTSTTAAGVVVAATSGRAYLKSIYTPALSEALLPERGGYPNWDMDIPGGVFRRLSGRFPTVTQGDRQEPTGSLTVITRTRQEQNELELLLRSPGPYLLHFSPESAEPDRYVMIGPTGPQRYTGLAIDPERRWELPLVVVDRPPTLGSYTTAPGKTYDADTALGGTWAADTALGQTYLQWVTP